MGDLEKAKKAAMAAADHKRFAYSALTRGMTAAGDMEGARTAYAKIGDEEPLLKHFIGLVEAAQEAVQDAPAGPQRKAAEENLKRCSRLAIRDSALPLNQNKTLDQLEIEAWSPRSDLHPTNKNIRASFDFTKSISFLKDMPPSILVGQSSGLVTGLMKELANHRRIAVDFKKRRRKASIN